METSHKSMQQMCLNMTSSWEDSLVKMSVLPENEKDFVDRELECSLRSSGYYEKNSLGLYSLKMLEESLVVMEDGTSPEFSLNWKTLGTRVNGKYLTQKITESPRTEKGCSLSDIIEDQVPDKYFLSQQSLKRFLKRGMGNVFVPERSQLVTNPGRHNGTEAQP